MAATLCRRFSSLRFPTRLGLKNASSTTACISFSRVPRVITGRHCVVFPSKTIFSKRHYCSADEFKEPASGYAYTAEHEWASSGEESVATVGISCYAQEKLGDVVYVELPEVGQEFSKGDILGVLESVKAAADVHCPVGGTVVEVNSKLEESPELVNKDPYKSGWLAKLKDVPPEDFESLMDSKSYKTFLEEGV